MNRTDTTHHYVFQVLGPKEVQFDFSQRNRIRITIASDSEWSVREHWHQNEPCCIRIDCLQGKLLLGYAVKPGSSGTDFIPPGSGEDFRKNARYGWKGGANLSREKHERNTEVILTVSNESLYRNTCSAALDSDMFPYLASTPAHLRLLFAVLRPGARLRLLNHLLWVQIQAMNYAHGYWEYHGRVPLSYLWRLLHPFDTVLPPKTWAKLEWQSADLFARMTEMACFWAGKLALGMKGEYPEYKPREPRSRDDKVDEMEKAQ